MIAIITGSTEYDNPDRVRQILDAAVDRLHVDAVITTDAHPCGLTADAWAAERDFQRIRVKDFTNTPEHNKLMLDITQGWSDRVVFAFPGTSGNMIAQANGAGIRVIEIDR